MRNQNILEIRNLSKNFKSRPALRDITMEIPQGCVYGLLGPNGAGKSTLLKMMTGILRPGAGTIYFQGHQWSRKDLVRIGALIETPPIYENLTAWENLKVKALLTGVCDKQIEEVLRLIGLLDTGKKRAGAFSLGMKQRLGIALALLGGPELLILDEPTNGLDPLGIQKLRHLIQEFREKGMTVILSSHILSEICQTADYIGIISDGRLGFSGRLDEHENLEELFMEVTMRGREG